MKSFIFTLCTAVVVARKAIKLGSGDAGSDIHASRRLGSGLTTDVRTRVGSKLKVRRAHKLEGVAELGSTVDAKKIARSNSLRDHNLMRRFKEELSSAQRFSEELGRANKTAGRSKSLRAGELKRRFEVLEGLVRNTTPQEEFSGNTSWKSWFQALQDRTAKDGEAIGFDSLGAATVSSVALLAVGQAPGPAPVPNGPAPAPFDFDSMRNGPLPSQGFEGANVQHVDGDTLTRDWRREFGPKARHRDMFAICADHPHNTWCSRNGYHPVHLPPKPMADEIVDAKTTPTTPSPLPATTQPTATCPGGSLAACLDKCNEHVDMPSLEMPSGMQAASNLSSVGLPVKPPADVSFLGAPSHTTNLPDGMVPDDLPSVNVGSSEQRACNDECLDLCDSLSEGVRLPKGLLPKADAPRMVISYSLLLVLAVSQILT